MKTIAWQDLKVEGEAYKRAMLSFDRMESEPYEPDSVFKDAAYDWPGDWEGRTILALVLLAQATHREPKHLAEIMSRLPGRLNDKGFFGPVYPAGTIDEQQLSGNSWFLRSMCEYHLWKKDAFSLSVIGSITEHLLLPASGYYIDYPVLPEQRVFEGEAIGELQKEKVGAWRLSTDIGCAFIMLDGATQAFQILKRPELGMLIDEMIEKFMTIDLAGLSFQTHATLSATRGLLRHYETTCNDALLRKAEDVFRLYMKEGMTETYANYNWFGRPDWTESCAVVDSFMVAVTLWKHTGKQELLDAAHHIYFNGMGYGQRPNGGFGCDVCTGAHDEMTIAPKSEGMFEAFWCCTMRGGEGLSRSVEYSYYLEEGRIVVPFYSDSVGRFGMESGGEIVINQRSAYPYEGYVQLEVTESSHAEPVTLKLYVPGWTDLSAVRLTVNGETRAAVVEDGFVAVTQPLDAGTTIELSFPIGLRVTSALGENSMKDVHSYRHGVLLLGVDGADSLQAHVDNGTAIEPLGYGVYRIADDTERILTPINDLIDKPLADAITNRKQVLFRA
ncbi:beta-L-arabinofuranosidase domain-containing protein [Paenibacillus mendelii]|uniref:Beta-L-arabinofuranosidase domain-containing protein n=1 Tax=Paenibacillus mendelii TaxID=206163 RepID=A0ABV6JB02_9BACL|nr:beta-L-arabinofuranosidase domain-containing protein [Paenibacillus mendelii]MCQ6562945.1 glycoside hydrolase family 127 protein [Paenibacillus mendelii]